MKCLLLLLLTDAEVRTPKAQQVCAHFTSVLLLQWDAFSIPELQNFLMILDKEEKEKIQQVHRKYERFKQRLQQTLKEARGKPG